MSTEVDRPTGPGILCSEPIRVGRLDLHCELPNRESAHAHGITDGVVHEAEYRNVGIRVRVSWEGTP